ncbi:GFA family protein [Rhizobium calliandrae]|uniref:GFA family protein n=1 Tax=Rhizobium calliandrae TaxID=1312182 RepID=A0ABT7KDZ9_9HYPH|nr:GFA family protein [Rhizobium calliandrae]MDL2406844.1 GFA family protein [Rhizobium calliandrae]
MCGAVRYKIESPPLGTGLCHCDRCRPQSGSAFSTVMYVPRRSLTVEGKTAYFADIGTSGLPVKRVFCPECGSPLFTDMDLTPEIMFVKVGTTDDNQWFFPSIEMFVVRRRSWLAPLSDVPQFDANPPI